MTDLRESIVVGLGEVLWDCFGEARKPGGAPANVAFHARQLGHAGVVCSRVGQDPLGTELIDTIARQHLDTRWIQRDPVHPTGTVTVDASRPDHPSYIIHENVAWDYIEFTTEASELMGRASAVCFGSLAQRSQPSRQTIQRCLDAAQGALLVFDVTLRQSWYDRGTIGASLAKADVAKMNTEEAAVLASLLALPKAPVDFARRMLERYDLDLVCITRAEQGCLLVDRQDVVDAPGVSVQVVDTVGSGDAFSAALISALLRGWSLNRAAGFANEVGSLVAGRSGAMPALAEEYNALVSRFASGDRPPTRHAPDQLRPGR
jgi:fructokinase